MLLKNFTTNCLPFVRNRNQVKIGWGLKPLTPKPFTSCSCRRARTCAAEVYAEKMKSAGKTNVKSRTYRNTIKAFLFNKTSNLQLSLKQRPRVKSAQIGRALSPENLSPPLSASLPPPPLSRDESLPRSLSAHALSRSPPLSRDLSLPPILRKYAATLALFLSMAISIAVLPIL